MSKNTLVHRRAEDGLVIDQAVFYPHCHGYVHSATT